MSLPRGRPGPGAGDLHGIAWLVILPVLGPPKYLDVAALKPQLVLIDEQGGGVVAAQVR